MRPLSLELGLVLGQRGVKLLQVAHTHSRGQRLVGHQCAAELSVSEHCAIRDLSHQQLHNDDQLLDLEEGRGREEGVSWCSCCRQRFMENSRFGGSQWQLMLVPCAQLV